MHISLNVQLQIPIFFQINSNTSTFSEFDYSENYITFILANVSFYFNKHAPEDIELCCYIPLSSPRALFNYYVERSPTGFLLYHVGFIEIIKNCDVMHSLKKVNTFFGNDHIIKYIHDFDSCFFFYNACLFFFLYQE